MNKIASTACETRALSDADAVKSYPAFAFGPVAVPFPLYGTSTEAPADVSANLLMRLSTERWMARLPT